jgi:hypothetical protein
MSGAISRSPATTLARHGAIGQDNSHSMARYATLHSPSSTTSGIGSQSGQGASARLSTTHTKAPGVILFSTAAPLVSSSKAADSDDGDVDVAVWAVLRGVTTAVGGTTAAAGVRQACGGMEGVGVEAGGRLMAGGTELEAEVAEEVRTPCP